jgi:mannose-6-phosphate isomerase-like protein (cupin superfamily)
MNEGTPEISESLKIWNQIGRATGAEAISLRILEFGPGLSPQLCNSSSDEVLYVLEPTTREVEVIIDDQSFAITSNTGIYLEPGRTFQVRNNLEHSIKMVSCCCPDETSKIDSEPALRRPPFNQKPFVRLADRKAEVTADRWYRVLVDETVGSEQVTQFVGSIPPGRAPDHFHHYEEVLFILRGEGRMWAGKSNTPIGPGSCVFLPKKQVHCVENTGSGELRLLGVFYPAGSPAVRYET